MWLASTAMASTLVFSFRKTRVKPGESHSPAFQIAKAMNSMSPSASTTTPSPLTPKTKVSFMCWATIFGHCRNPQMVVCISLTKSIRTPISIWKIISMSVSTPWCSIPTIAKNATLVPMVAFTKLRADLPSATATATILPPACLMLLCRVRIPASLPPVLTTAPC